MQAFGGKRTDGGERRGDKAERKADRVEAAPITDVGRRLREAGRGLSRLGKRAAAGVVQHTGPARGWAGGSASHKCNKKQELSGTFGGSLALNSTMM